MTPDLQIRVVPMMGTVLREPVLAYQLVNAHTLETLRDLKEHEAQAMMTELIPIVRVKEANLL